MHFVSMYVSCLSPCWICTHSYQSHVFTTLVTLCQKMKQNQNVFLTVFIVCWRDCQITISQLDSSIPQRILYGWYSLSMGANMCLYICLYVLKICRFKHHINNFSPRFMDCHQILMFINFPMWVILEMGSPEVASFNKSWSSMTWMMHRGTPMTSDNHGFSLFSIVSTDFPKTPPSFPKCLSNKNPHSRLFSRVFSAFSPRCAGCCRNAVEGHRAAFPRLFWLNNCEATWWNDNAWSLDHGGTFAYLTLFSKVKVRTGKCETNWLLWRLNGDLDDVVVQVDVSWNDNSNRPPGHHWHGAAQSWKAWPSNILQYTEDIVIIVM